MSNRNRPRLEMLERRLLLAERGSVGGTVFDDINGNGRRDSGEPGLAGQVVFVDANLNGLREAGERSVLSSADGAYLLSDLPNGTHRIRHEPPSGRRLTSPFEIFHDAAVPPQLASGTRDFGNSTMGVVRGTVFNDLNGDGLKQSGEAGLPGWRLFVDKDGDGLYDPGLEKTRITNSRGEYRFADLTPGKYVIRIEQQGGFMRLNPANGMFKVTITSGKSFSNRNFAERDNDKT